MNEAVSGLVAIAIFMLVTVLVFQVLDIAWNTQVDAHQDFARRLEDRQPKDIDVESPVDTTADCLTYTATVTNNGDTEVVSRLVHTTDWTVCISPDDRDANSWNPGEIATITFTLASAPKDNTRGTLVVGTPLGVVDSAYFSCICVTGNTGYLSPTAHAADTGGDGDGFETNPTYAFDDDSVPAPNVGGDGDRHRFSTYGMSLKSSCSVSGNEVKLDWWLSALGGGNSMDVELSWDNGASWTAAKTDALESTSERSVVLGSFSDAWGRMWASYDFADDLFLVRATTNGSGSPTYFLDWAPVKVYYTP